LRNRVLGHGEAKLENRASLRPILTGDLSLVVLDHSVSNAQSQSHALTDCLGGIEGIENAPRIADAGTGVRKLHHQFLPLLKDAHRKCATTHLFQSVDRIPDDFHAALKKL